jgi:uncharacterized membrane protein YhhN
MSELGPSLLFAMAGFLAHCGFVQLWLNNRGGLARLWNFRRTTRVLTVVRATFIIGILFALLTAVPPLRLVSTIVAAGCFLAHLTVMAVFVDRL